MKKYFAKLIYALFVCLLLGACKSAANDDAEEAPKEILSPVTVTSVSYEPLHDSIVLNATSTFLQQNFVKSNLIGYIQKANIKYGDRVHRGQVLFVLKTK